MKRKLPVLVGLGILGLLVMLSACSPAGLEQKLEQFEEQVEQKLEAAQNTAASILPTAAPGMLTAADAESIAFAHAGLQGQTISRIKTQYEQDNRIPHYEVEFYHNGIEYNYEIHAETGEILSFEQEQD